MQRLGQAQIRIPLPDIEASKHSAVGGAHLQPQPTHVHCNFPLLLQLLLALFKLSEGRAFPYLDRLFTSSVIRISTGAEELLRMGIVLSAHPLGRYQSSILDRVRLLGAQSKERFLQGMETQDSPFANWNQPVYALLSRMPPPVRSSEEHRSLLHSKVANPSLAFIETNLSNILCIPPWSVEISDKIHGDVLSVRGAF